MAERRKAGLPATIVAGGIIGAVAAVLAVSFAAIVFNGELSPTTSPRGSACTSAPPR